MNTKMSSMNTGEQCIRRKPNGRYVVQAGWPIRCVGTFDSIAEAIAARDVFRGKHCRDNRAAPRPAAYPAVGWDTRQLKRRGVRAPARVDFATKAEWAAACRELLDDVVEVEIEREEREHAAAMNSLMSHDMTFSGVNRFARDILGMRKKQVA